MQKGCTLLCLELGSFDPCMESFNKGRSRARPNMFVRTITISTFSHGSVPLLRRLKSLTSVGLTPEPLRVAQQPLISTFSHDPSHLLVQFAQGRIQASCQR